MEARECLSSPRWGWVPPIWELHGHPQSGFYALGPLRTPIVPAIGTNPPIWVLDVGGTPVPLVPRAGGGCPQSGCLTLEALPCLSSPRWVRDFVAIGAPNWFLCIGSLADSHRSRAGCPQSGYYMGVRRTPHHSRAEGGCHQFFILFIDFVIIHFLCSISFPIAVLFSPFF